MLALSSDWAFMVTKNSAADYARRRAHDHTARFDALAEALHTNDPGARRLAERYGASARPFGHLDARDLLNPPTRRR